MAGGHRKLSPSGAHRWMNCPASVNFIGDESSTTNMAAMKGTAAHKIVELMVTGNEQDASKYSGYTLLVHEPGEHETEAYPPGVAALDPDTPRPGWFMFICDDEMVYGVQVTIDEVERQKASLYKPEVFAETFLDGSWLDDRLGGTADVRLAEPFGRVVLVDHKNGYILVEVKDNEQLLNYAVLVLREHPDAEEIEIIISQPNAPHIDGPVRSAVYTRDEIKLFEIRMKEAAEAVDKPNAPFRAGDWCTFCPAAHRCKENEDAVMREALSEFEGEDEPPVDGVNTAANLPSGLEELARVARWVPVLQARAANIMAAVQRELENDHKVPGFKLVMSEGHRKIPDEQMMDCANELVEAGAPNEAIWTDPELKSPAQLEKVIKGRGKAIKVTRDAVKEVVAKYARKPPGKITVATDDDPREAVDPVQAAADEFAEDDGGDFDP